MEFPDFKSNSDESYVHHSEVCRYLRDYSRHYQLDQYVCLEHHLKLITRMSDSQQWLITVHNLTERRTFTKTYDILILCPGRHSIPNWPLSLNGTWDQFTAGPVIHSHDYRCRESYTGQRVAVIGGGPSGIDICLEISKVAEDVIFINRTKNFQPLPSNVHQINATLYGFRKKSILIKLNYNSVDDHQNYEQERVDIFKLNYPFSQNQDDNRLVEFEVDSIIMATGYRFNLAYLDQDSCGLRWNTETDTIEGLYRHMINIKYPNMILLGVLQRSVLPFPLYHQQVS